MKIINKQSRVRIEKSCTWAKLNTRQKPASQLTHEKLPKRSRVFTSFISCQNKTIKQVRVTFLQGFF